MQLLFAAHYEKNIRKILLQQAVFPPSEFPFNIEFEDVGCLVILHTLLQFLC